MVYPCPKCNHGAVFNEQGVAQPERDVTPANKNWQGRGRNGGDRGQYQQQGHYQQQWQPQQ